MTEQRNVIRMLEICVTENAGMSMARAPRMRRRELLDAKHARAGLAGRPQRRTAHGARTDDDDVPLAPGLGH